MPTSPNFIKINNYKVLLALMHNPQSVLLEPQTEERFTYPKHFPVRSSSFYQCPQAPGDNVTDLPSVLFFQGVERFMTTF